MWFNIRGDERLGRCATEGCGGQPTFRLEADGTGSNYCSGCKASIESAAMERMTDGYNILRSALAWFDSHEVEARLKHLPQWAADARELIARPRP